MYTDRNFKTKKALKEAVATFNAQPEAEKAEGRRGVTYHQPGPFGGNERPDGMIFIEGPHGNHKWYAQCTAKDGYIVAVK